MSRNSDGGLPVLATEGQVAKLGMAVRKLSNVRGHNGIIVANNAESIDIILARAAQDSVGGGGIGVSLYQLTGYYRESQSDPPGRSFMGRVATFGPDPPTGTPIRIFTWRNPWDFDLPQCNPLLEEWFGSDNPEHWVPCVSVPVPNPAFDPEAEPDPDNPVPEFVTAPRILWLFRGYCE